MPSISRIAAGMRVNYLRRLWWETVRRYVEYRTDLSRLLRCLRAETAGQRRRSRASISGGAVPSVPYTIASPDDEPSAVFASLTKLREPDSGSRRVEGAHDALNLYRAMWKLVRREPTADVAALYLGRSRIDLPELAAFESKWGLRFPVPPRAETTPGRLMCAPITHPVRIASDSPPVLVLDIWRPAGRAVLDHIAGILDHYQEHRDEALPPCWSLSRIETAVRQQFGAAAVASENADEVRDYRAGLARQAGYPSYLNLQRRVGHLVPGPTLEEAAAAEDTAAMALLHKRGIPPRQARKGGDPGDIVIEERVDGWLQMTLRRPEAIDFGTVATMLKPRLKRSPVTIRFDEMSHRRIFRVQDLARRGRTAAQIAEVMDLEDAESRGRERVAELKAAYGDLIRRFRLPALSRSITRLSPPFPPIRRFLLPR